MNLSDEVFVDGKARTAIKVQLGLQNRILRGVLGLET